MSFQQKTLFSNSEILTTSKPNTNSKTIKIVKKQFSLNVQKKNKNIYSNQSVGEVLYIEVVQNVKYQRFSYFLNTYFIVPKIYITDHLSHVNN